MKGVLIVVGKTTDKRFEAITQEYIERIRHYIPFTVEVIPELKNTKGLSQDEQKKREGELIQKNLQPGDYVVLLDEHGSERSSMDFASWIQKKMAAGPKRLVFIVGGPYGFSDAIHQKGNEEISLSRMTLSHQMIRMFFVEQIYRAMTILNGEPYHHE
ncbi:MAG: 23S rRNA (pseudouridine(1915)-N(3))-methyltransferase RlmH [Bacteroidaceae bacterium]|nr:23S rRNA (pseudouridine(1915)-N(3))-methyltransferase RlmH [Bacteroidaceae bacterium]MBR0543902.1 23S rRNA (pseudouridine(1915)-N(3))-methyltransferase RlmH [Bacteroidaceae bacterium]